MVEISDLQGLLLSKGARSGIFTGKRLQSVVISIGVRRKLRQAVDNYLLYVIEGLCIFPPVVDEVLVLPLV